MPGGKVLVLYGFAFDLQLTLYARTVLSSPGFFNKHLTEATTNGLLAAALLPLSRQPFISAAQKAEETAPAAQRTVGSSEHSPSRFSPTPAARPGRARDTVLQHFSDGSPATYWNA
jgi:hypothetical protein